MKYAGPRVAARGPARRTERLLAAGAAAANDGRPAAVIGGYFLADRRRSGWLGTGSNTNRGDDESEQGEFTARHVDLAGS